MDEMAGRIDVVIIIAGISECFAGLGCEADGQSRREKDPHQASPRIMTRDRDALVEKAKRQALDDTAAVRLQRRVLALR
jgi:hypothetical protein